MQICAVGLGRQGLSCDDSGYCRWRKALDYAYGLPRVALVLIRDQYRGMSGSTSRTVLEEGVADGRRWPVASSSSASCKSLIVVAGASTFPNGLLVLMLLLLLLLLDPSNVVAIAGSSEQAIYIVVVVAIAVWNSLMFVAAIPTARTSNPSELDASAVVIVQSHC